MAPSSVVMRFLHSIGATFKGHLQRGLGNKKVACSTHRIEDVNQNGPIREDAANGTQSPEAEQKARRANGLLLIAPRHVRSVAISDQLNERRIVIDGKEVSKFTNACTSCKELKTARRSTTRSWLAPRSVQGVRFRVRT